MQLTEFRQSVLYLKIILSLFIYIFYTFSYNLFFVSFIVVNSMDASSEEESTPLVETSTISTHSHSTSNNIRRTQKTQIGINLILVTILFEVAAYYTYNSNLSVSLSHNQTLNWTSENADKAVIIYDGKSIFQKEN